MDADPGGYCPGAWRFSDADLRCSIAPPQLLDLSRCEVDVKDFSDGCGAKFDVFIVSDVFTGKPLLERHRMVNGVLSEEIPSIHALTLKTWTTSQWKSSMTSC
ncbi:uncharacterized protein DEA37_0009751 [Paragonimus westermani]|uniref:BolA protein n=1 Tax=Paragonimus westermani TaxID=34504 RepID=A0A5J4NZY9_9TREM|nr:uncharacterized protein DEA37_0009751 [Paragonimus westermani]